MKNGVKVDVRKRFREKTQIQSQLPNDPTMMISKPIHVQV